MSTADKRIKRLELVIEEAQQCLNIEAEALKKKALKNKELKPYEWGCRKGFYIHRSGELQGTRELTGNSLFNFDDKPQANAFAHKLKIMSVMLNLKKELGDDTEFVKGEEHHSIFYDNLNLNNCWKIACIWDHDHGSIYFTPVNAGKISHYLNKHFSKGWAL